VRGLEPFLRQVLSKEQANREVSVLEQTEGANRLLCALRAGSRPAPVANQDIDAHPARLGDRHSRSTFGGLYWNEMDRLLAIYPSARKVEEVLKGEGRSRCRFGYRAMTFPQLIDGLWRESGPDAALLSPVGERLVIEEVLHKPGTPRPEKLIPTPGMTECILGLVREFKSAMLEARDLGDAAASFGADANARIVSFASVLADYNEHLKRMHLADGHDRARMVLDFILGHERRGTRPRFLDGVEQLLVSEIYDFSLLQFMIVTALIRLIGDARLTIQAEPHKVDAMRFADLTWNRFVGEESIADKVLPDFVRRDGRSGRLGFLVRHVFEETNEPPPPDDGTVRVIEAPDRYREIEEIARAIRRVMEPPAQTRIALGRIAVLARDLGPYLGYLEAVFARYGIPIRIQTARALSTSAPARLALDLASLVTENYRREAFDALLSSPLLPVTHREQCRTLLRNAGYIDRATAPLGQCISRYESNLKRAAADQGKIFRREAVERDLRNLDRAAPELERLLDTIGALEAEGIVADHARRLRQAIGKLRIELPDRPAPEVARAYAGFEQILDELARSAALAAPQLRMSVQEFAELFESALSQTPAENGSDGTATAGVQALSVLDARGLDFDLVFIIGLSDGGFPTYRCEDPLLPDAIRFALNAPLKSALRRRLGERMPGAIGKILRTSSDHNSEDWLLFFLALSTAEREVVLSYPTADEGGAPLGRSPFVAEVLRLLCVNGGEESIVERRGAQRLAPDLNDCFTRGEFLRLGAFQGVLDHAESSMIAGSARIESIKLRSAIERRRERYLSMPTREETGADESEPRKLALVDSYDGRVPADERLRAMLLGPSRSPRQWNPSQLSELGACGFRFLADRIFRLREVEEPDFESSPLELGELVHRVLHELFASGVSFKEREAAQREARRILQSIYREAHAAARHDAFFDLAWGRVRKIVEEAVDFEVDAGIGVSAPSELALEKDFTITLRDRRSVPESERIDLLLAGRADRVELYCSGGQAISKLRVLDYKTSRSAHHYRKKANPEKNEFGQTEFQLPVYLMAALGEFRDRLASSATFEAGYFVLRSFDKLHQFEVQRERVESDAGLRTQIAASGSTDNVADRIISLVVGALAGQFDVDPRQCDDFCPFRRVCRYEKPRNRN
jgi:ATP-dependent helicase/DNAse subunit B